MICVRVSQVRTSIAWWRLSAFQQMGRAKYKRGDKMTLEKVTFKDVAGLKEPKVEIMEFVEYLKNPDKFKVISLPPST